MKSNNQGSALMIQPKYRFKMNRFKRKNLKNRQDMAMMKTCTTTKNSSMIMWTMTLLLHNQPSS